MGLRTGNCSLHSDAKLVPATSSPLYVHFFGLARRAECLIHTAAEYDSKASLTPYRLHALFSEEKPAAPLGTALLGAIDGKGFVAGMFHAIVRHDHCDVIWHTGGDTWLIDGETNPQPGRLEAVRHIRAAMSTGRVASGEWPVPRATSNYRPIRPSDKFPDTGKLHIRKGRIKLS